MDADGTATERTAVRTYVPEYQKAHWQEEADRLSMSLSEFVRTMVQAGRRDLLEEARATTSDADATSGDPPSASADLDLHADVVDALSETEYLSWEEIVDAVVGDVEDRIEDVLQELQAENRVQYSGRRGGYTLTDE